MSVLGALSVSALLGVSVGLEIVTRFVRCFVFCLARV
jgi:hypothetical protein